MSADTRFPIVELRRYSVLASGREAFARCFDAYFPPVFRQLGAVVLGQFCERGNPTGFTWLRGFRGLEDRLVVNTAFYGGPVWDEHGPKMNSRLTDHSNVLLLGVVEGSDGMLPLPDVDVADETGGGGVTIVMVFPVEPASVRSFTADLMPYADELKARGARHASVLATVEAPNDFPRLPYREDGPFVVWLAVVENDEALRTRVRPGIERLQAWAAGSGHLRAAPERIVMDPTPRSRLRFL